ncbi:MAG: amino acid permease [Terriglobia bacterium]
MGHSSPPLIPTPVPVAPHAVAAREDTLARRLSPRQVSMIALGGAVGTGFFLGSGVSVRLAGPGVILAYALGGFIALVIAWSLAEMAVVHPVAGSFGVYAEIYLHPWAGFTMRYSYWVGVNIAVGSEVVAVAIYCHFWFPHVPGWLWVGIFSLSLLAANAWTVASFGEFEFWLALIKVVTIVTFILVGVALLFGFGPFPARGLGNYTGQGGFLPNGWRGVLLATSLATFSYFGVEEVAVAAGEARDPAHSIPRAMRSVFWRLGLFYIGGITVLVGLVPWPVAGLDASPFVRAFQAVGVGAAPTLMNLVVLTAALSSANALLYLSARMIFSLARGGYAPEALGYTTSRGIPIWALAASGVGMGLAVLAETYIPGRAYLALVGTSMFAGLYVWIMILLTHLRFRRVHRNDASAHFMPASPLLNVVALAGLFWVTLSTWFVPGLRITLMAGVPWLVSISLAYGVWHTKNRA